MIFPVALPKLIHIVWFDHGNGREVFGDYARVFNEIQNFHPGWKVCLWKEDDVEYFLKHKFDHPQAKRLVELYHSCTEAIIANDFARLMILFHFGGFYTDLDVNFTRPFDHKMLRLFPGVNMLFFPMKIFGKLNDFCQIKKCWGPYNNALMAATRRSPWLDAFLTDIAQRPLSNHPIRYLRVMCSLGPLRITKFVLLSHRTDATCAPLGVWPGTHLSKGSWLFKSHLYQTLRSCV
jgi:mannosyltransferase OCH1-like enzyme